MGNWDTRTGGGSAARSASALETLLLNYTDLAARAIPVAAASGDASGATDTAALVAAIATAKALAASSGAQAIVRAKAGQTYQLAASGSTSVQFPLGSRASRDYALLLPSGVTLDMSGSTLQQRGAAEFSLVMNEGVAGIGATLSAGLNPAGGAITTLAVNATNVAIPSGSLLVANSTGANGKRQVFTTSAPAISGATSISIISTTPTFAFPSGTGLSVRDTSIGLHNAVLDLRGVTYALHSGLHFAYIDSLSMRHVKIKNAIRGFGWIYDVMKGDFDEIGSESMQGEGWMIGDPSATGLNHNGVYESQFGRIWGRDITLLDTVSQPGNSFDLILCGCTIESIYARNCSGGVKIQQPSMDVSVGSVVLDTIGEATALQGGFKIQGDGSGAFPVPTDRPQRINVGQVVVRNCVNVGLYLYHTLDCSVGSYVGYKNVQYHDAFSDVVLAGGINDYVGSIRSDLSGGGGVQFTQDNAATGPAGFRLPSVKVTNPGQLGSTLTSALSTGGPITALPVAATTFPLASGHSVIVTNGTQSQTFTTSGAIAVGATSIPVASLTPNFAYAIGSKVIGALIRQGVRGDTTFSGSIGEVETIDDQAIHTGDTGFGVIITTTSVAVIGKFTSSGFTVAGFSSSSAGVGTLNIADTSGATLAQLETTVNAMKKLHRDRGEWI